MNKQQILSVDAMNFIARGQIPPRPPFKTWLVWLLLAVLNVGLYSTIKADVSCEKLRPLPSVVKNRVTYLGPFNSTSSTELRADPNDAARRVELKGLLYYPSGTVKEAPVIIYNHGHDQDRGEPNAIAEYFVTRGFVVFAPLRRGHFYEAGFSSTGIHTDVFTVKCQRSPATAKNGDLSFLFCGSVFCRQDVPCNDPNRDNALDVGYMRMQKDDVSDQLNYIKKHPAVNTGGKLADPTRIAILGHSYGGSLIVFANEYDYGQNVAINISGAEKSWGTRNPFWESDLTAAMDGQKRPVYFLQPKNGRSLEPTETLFAQAIKKQYRAQAAIFPLAPWDSKCPGKKKGCWDSAKNQVKPEWEQAHSTFIGNSEQVNLWGCSVIDFINRYPLS